MGIRTGDDYLASLRGRKLRVYLHGELVDEPVDHPIIRPSANAVAATYDLAVEDPELGSIVSPLTGEPTSRFLHVAHSAEELVAQNRMQRRLGQLTGSCFQRCVGMDALNALYSVTYEVDEAYGTSYHGRLLAFMRRCQRDNVVLGGAMTDPKGDRSKSPAEQDDPDLYVRVVERRADGIVLRGAKAHQTGCVNSHWIVVMPTTRLSTEEKDYAVACAIPADDPALTYLYGRQSCDDRALEAGDLDRGNARFAGQEALIVIDDAFVPFERVFLDGEAEFAAALVERFASFHRRSYVCKTGVGDVLIGAAATLADYNGVARASHVRDKLVEMAHLNETIYAAGIASSFEAQPTAAGNVQNDAMLANVCKHNVTRFPFELARLAQDLAGGLMATLPSERELRSPVTGPLLQKYLRGRAGVRVEDRLRMLRLVESLTMGRHADSYLVESVHGAGSPQAQRILIGRLMDLDQKKRLAQRLAGIAPPQGDAE